MDTIYPNLFDLFYTPFWAESQLKVDQCLFSGKVLLFQSTFFVLLVDATIHLQKIGPFLQLSFQLFLHIFPNQTNSFRPQLVRARLVSLNKSCFFDSARSASTPKHFSPIFCRLIPTWFDACSLFLFLYAICFHFQWKYIFINLSFFIGSFREKTFKTS